MQTRLGQLVRFGLFLVLLGFSSVILPVASFAAPYAAMVIDARTGKVLHSRNADTRLHPASLTKMMTLYIVFQAVEHGEISLDTMVTISKRAASEQPSKLGLRAGQRIQLRYLIRAAAVKSANDAATALAEAISGSVPAFARRMNRTAKDLGMTRTAFKNANGLTQSGHYSTARDMTTLGRHVLYDYPQYYNLFSRITTDAGVRTVKNTNRRFLNSYTGADGIKTGYTAAAGFNLVASAQRGNERIIATVFGGRSTASRNAKVAELLDLGFRRAPSNASLRRPALPPYSGSGRSTGTSTAPAVTASANQAPPAGRTIRLVTAVSRSPRPTPRPLPEIERPSEALIAAIESEVESTVEQVVEEAAIEVAEAAPVVSTATRPAPRPDPVSAPAPDPTPTPASDPTPDPAPSEPVVLASAQVEAVVQAVAEPSEPEIITRISTSGGSAWGVDVGLFRTRYDAERVLLKTALNELSLLGDALRKPANRADGWHANFVGMTRDAAELACRRLDARNITCSVIGPT